LSECNNTIEEDNGEMRGSMEEARNLIVDDTTTTVGLTGSGGDGIGSGGSQLQLLISDEDWRPIEQSGYIDDVPEEGLTVSTLSLSLSLFLPRYVRLFISTPSHRALLNFNSYIVSDWCSCFVFRVSM